MIIEFRLQDEKARQDYQRLRTEVDNLMQDIKDSAKAQSDVFEQHGMTLNRFNKQIEEIAASDMVFGEIRTLQTRMFENEKSVREATRLGSDRYGEMNRRVHDLEVFRMSQNQVNYDLQAADTLRGSYTPEEHQLAIRLDRVEHELAATNKKLKDLAKLLDTCMRPKVKK